MAFASAEPVASEALDHGAERCRRSVRVEIGARLAVSLQMTDRRRDALDVRCAQTGEHTTESLIRRRSLLHDLKQPRMLPVGVEIAPIGQVDARQRIRGLGRTERGVEAIDQRLDDSHEHRILRGEPGVHGAVADTRGLGDIAHARAVVAALLEDTAGRRDESIAGAATTIGQWNRAHERSASLEGRSPTGMSTSRARRCSPKPLACGSLRAFSATPRPSSPWMTMLTACRLGR